MKRERNAGVGIFATVAVLLFVSPAFANCGSAFCVLNTSWDMQGMAAEPGRARLDLRYEFIRQDRLRSGSHSASRSETTGEAAELRTLNRNLLVTLDYTITPDWGVSLTLPLISRSHSHIADPTGAAQLESWDFTRVGDARVLGRYQAPALASAAGRYGVEFGLKLPTGDYRVTNAEGSLAERSLQPGTGSTDLILGAYYSHRPPYQGTGWFVQGLIQRAVFTRDGYRPGDQYSLSVGLRHPFTGKLDGLFQVNALARERDSGVNAEPEVTGGKFLFASPGLSYSFIRDVRVYGFIQLPIYRYVNGVQLSADWSLIAGASLRF